MKRSPLDHAGGTCSVGARCAVDLRAAVDGAEAVLRAIDEEASGRRPAPDTWSPREVIGHLIDSASNNHRRFVMGQVQEDLQFPGYDQNVWVSVQRYREAPWANLVTLWTSFNRHLAFIIESAPDDVLLRPRGAHNLPEIGWHPPEGGEPATLAHIVRDYIAHLRHHLAQIPEVKG
jgi:DinB superfamily